MGVSIPVIFGFYKYPNWCYPEHSGTYDVHYHVLEASIRNCQVPVNNLSPLRRFHTPLRHRELQCHAYPGRCSGAGRCALGMIQNVTLDSLNESPNVICSKTLDSFIGGLDLDCEPLFGLWGSLAILRVTRPFAALGLCCRQYVPGCSNSLRNSNSEISKARVRLQLELGPTSTPAPKN